MFCIALSLCYKGYCQGYYEAKSIAYNSIVGAITGGVGAVINKKPEQKWQRALMNGLTGGVIGGGMMYLGKRTNYLITSKRNISYAWLSRLVFSVGNSLVENAAANQPLLSRFHYDLGFIRVDLYTRNFALRPRISASSLGATLFMAFNGRFDLQTSLRSGTFTFRKSTIEYAPYLKGSTPGNGFILVDTLRSGILFHEIYAHEMIHAFQFLEHSAFNNFFIPQKKEWESSWPAFQNWNRWIHGDLNFEIMLGNYFIIQGGYRRILYCRNFLENEAEVLSTGRVSCPVDH